MFKKILVPTISLFLSLSTLQAFGIKKCYDLSKDGKNWSRTPEQICLTNPLHNLEPLKTKIDLIHGLFKKKTVATFNLDLIESLRYGPQSFGMIYGVENPNNSIFNELKIEFKGQTQINEDGTSSEVGTVLIGKNKFHYKNSKR